MEKCYEYFDCKEKECPMFNKEVLTPCWDTDGTLCTHKYLSEGLMKKMNIVKCELCLYFKQVNS